jgi:hypothetical protein
MSLEQKDLIDLNRTGEHLKNTLRNIIIKFPPTAQTIAGMSKWLDFNRSNCQRILNGVYKAKSGQQVLCYLPGIAGLEDFLIQATKQEHELQLLVDAKNAIELFDKQIRKYARSHAELKRLLDERVSTFGLKHGALTAQEKRKKHFVASKQLVDTAIDTLFSCYILKENQQNKNFLCEISMISKQKISRTEVSLPFVQFYTPPHSSDFNAPEKITAQSKIETDGFHVGVVEEYSALGLLEAYSSYSPSNSGLVFNGLPSGEPFDATFIFTNSNELANPLMNKSECSSTSISIKNPTQKLIMLVFLEKKLDMRSTVNIGCYTGNQKVEEGKLCADDMWTERLPEFPELNVVHPSSPRAKKNQALALGEMTDYLFNFAELKKENFVCYMVEVDYPIWSSTYRLYFEHA